MPFDIYHVGDVERKLITMTHQEAKQILENVQGKEDRTYDPKSLLVLWMFNLSKENVDRKMLKASIHLMTHTFVESLLRRNIHLDPTEIVSYLDTQEEVDEIIYKLWMCAVTLDNPQIIQRTRQFVRLGKENLRFIFQHCQKKANIGILEYLMDEFNLYPSETLMYEDDCDYTPLLQFYVQKKIRIKCIFMHLHAMIAKYDYRRLSDDFFFKRGIEYVRIVFRACRDIALRHKEFGKVLKVFNGDFMAFRSFEQENLIDPSWIIQHPDDCSWFFSDDCGIYGDYFIKEHGHLIKDLPNENKKKLIKCLISDDHKEFCDISSSIYYVFIQTV
jgi:hypothetical protein